MQNSRNISKKYSNSLKRFKVPILETHENLEEKLYTTKRFFSDLFERKRGLGGGGGHVARSTIKIDFHRIYHLQVDYIYTRMCAILLSF